MPSLRHSLRLSSLLLSGSLLGACTSSPLAPEVEALPEVEELAPDVEALPDVEEAASGLYSIIAVLAPVDGMVEVELRLKHVSVDSRVASYQGQLSYPTELLELESVELPAGVTGTSHEGAAGTLRFVGAALDGLSGEVLAVARFRSTGAPAVEDFALNIEEVAAGGDLRDLSHLIVNSAPAESASI